MKKQIKALLFWDREKEVTEKYETREMKKIAGKKEH